MRGRSVAWAGEIAAELAREAAEKSDETGTAG